MRSAFIAILIAIFAIGMVYAAPTPVSKTTSTGATVSAIWSLTFYTDGDYVRSTTGDFNFATVDGSRTWYYNSVASLGTPDEFGEQSPTDGKADVGLIVKSNTLPYYLKIQKTADAMTGKIGYNVSGAFDRSSATVGTPADGTVNYPNGFKGSVGTGDQGWGAIPETAATIYSNTTTAYALYGVLVPFSYALVPDGLVEGSYSTTITYTLTPTA